MGSPQMKNQRCQVGAGGNEGPIPEGQKNRSENILPAQVQTGKHSHPSSSPDPDTNSAIHNHAHIKVS